MKHGGDWILKKAAFIRSDMTVLVKISQWIKLAGKTSMALIYDIRKFS